MEKNKTKITPVMSEEARAARNAYFKKWRDANKEKVKESTRRYWERKAQAIAKEG